MIRSVPIPLTEVRVGDTVCAHGTDRPIGTVTICDRVEDKIRYKDDGLILSVMFDLDVVIYVLREGK